MLNVCQLCVRTCYTQEVGGGEVRASSAGRSPHGGVKLVWSKHITESNYRGEVLSPRDPQPGGWGGSSLACRSTWMSDPRQDLPTAGALRGERVRSGSSPLNWLRMTPHRLPSLPSSLTAPRCAPLLFTPPFLLPRLLHSRHRPCLN